MFRPVENSPFIHVTPYFISISSSISSCVYIYIWKNRFDRFDAEGRKATRSNRAFDSRAIFSVRRDRRTDRSFHPAGDNALNRQSDRRLTPPCRVNTRSLFLFRRSSPSSSPFRSIIILAYARYRTRTVSPAYLKAGFISSVCREIRDHGALTNRGEEGGGRESFIRPAEKIHPPIPEPPPPPPPEYRGDRRGKVASDRKFNASILIIK